MDAGLLMVPKLEPRSGGAVANGTLNRATVAIVAHQQVELVVGGAGGRGRTGCRGNKQKQRSGRDGELILVMEPQNPSPTKYFDQNGLPLKKELVENEHPAGKPSSKKRSKLTLICHKCFGQFESNFAYELHYRESHNQEPIYCCTTCDKQITQYKAYRLHIYRHLNSANQRYTCGTCAKVFHQKSDLTRHENVHESHTAAAVAASSAKSDLIAAFTVEGKINCNQCDAVFGTQAEVRIHAKKIHKPPTVCPVCDKPLKAGSVYSHRKIHLKVPPFNCSECNRTFVQKINLIQHRKQHFPNDVRQFPCGECGKEFYEKSHLQRHQLFHSNERPYKCELCGKCYKTERCLKVHSAVHNAERPFVCPECNKGFLSSSKLRQHSNIHSGLRPFKCKYCTRDFTNFPNWLKHIRRRHKVDHRTGEKLDSVPKFMTKKKDKPADKKDVTAEKPKPAPQPAPTQTLPLAIKEESLPFVGENSNIDLNLVSKDDLLQPLKIEEMDDILLALPGAGISAIVADDEDAQHAVELPPVAGVNDEALTEVDTATDTDFIEPPPLGMSEDDNDLFQFDYGEQEFDCDFSIKNEAVNVIRENDEPTADSPGPSDGVGAASAPSVALPAATGALVFDINGERPVFPALISIYGDEPPFRFINPNSIHLPQVREGSGGSSNASDIPGPSGSGLKVESP